MGRSAFNLWARKRQNAYERGIKFSLTVADIDSLLKALGEVCPRCGIPWSTGFEPTLDRVDCFGGYELGNVQFICRQCNQKKSRNEYGLWRRHQKALRKDPSLFFRPPKK